MPGRATWRNARDETRGLAELFSYDRLNRLTGWQVRQDGTRTSTPRMALGANDHPDVPGPHGREPQPPHPETLRRDGRVCGRGSDTRNGLRARNRVHLVLPPGEHHERHVGDEYSYDPWGNLRDRKRWRLTPPEMC